jgi:CheY-like chemotaxis protein
VVGEAANGRLAVEYSERFHPDVVLMDLSMPEMNGLQATYAIKKGSPETAIVALTRHDDAAFVEELKKAGSEDIIVVCGGVIPPQDYDFLRQAGVAAIYGPGTNIPKAAADIMGIIRG